MKSQLNLCVQSEFVTENVSSLLGFYVSTGGGVVAVSEQKLFLIPPGGSRAARLF